MAGKTKVKSMLEEALDYAAVGIGVFPLHGVLSDGSCQCGEPNCSQVGKHPKVAKGGFHQASTDPKRIKQWWKDSRWPNASIGGVGEQWLCLDIDAKSGGYASLEKLIAANSPLPDTAVAETGLYEVDGEEVRGKHYWFRLPEGVRLGSRTNLRPGIDIRCRNGYAVLPPSPHKSGVNYEWLNGGLGSAVEAPEWLIEECPPAADPQSTWEPTYLPISKEVFQFSRGELEVPAGDQRTFACRAARAFLAHARPVEEVANLIWTGLQGCEWDDEPWTEEDALFIVESEFSDPPPPPKNDFSEESNVSLRATDVGNAGRLLNEFDPGCLRYIPSWGIWYIWDGDDYVEDDGGFLRLKFEREVTPKIMKEDYQNEAEMKLLANHARASRQKQRVDAAVSLAKDYVALDHKDLNADLFLFNCQNGVVDLRTGDLLEPDPRYLLTKRSRASYDPDAQSDAWDEFIERIVPDKELRDFLQLAFGYTLTGDVSEHVFFYLHGPPGSGKSTFLEALAHLMGNYAESADASTFMRKENRSGAGPSEDIARLANARMVVTHEAEAKSQWAEGHLSRLTGGDTVSARFSYQKTFEFIPKFKLWFSANNKPRVAAERSGIWRRIQIIPMEQEISREERNPQLPSHLRSPEVQSAVLAWAVEGAVRWYKRNAAGHTMEVPETVQEEVEQYMIEEDPLAGFVTDYVEVTGDPDDLISKRDLYDIYLHWASEQGYDRPWTQKTFSGRFKRKGFSDQPRVWFSDLKKELDCWVKIKVKGSGIKLPSKES